MRSKPLLVSALLAVLLVAPLAAYAANSVSAGIVTVSTDKASYYPNSAVTITVKFSAPFTGSLLIQVVGPNGQAVAADAASLTNATQYVYVFKHDEAKYGDGVFKVVVTYSGKALVAGNWETVYSAKPLELSFTVAPAYSISGKVVDENGKPVAGATVVVKETGASTTTAEDGSFVVSVPGPGKYTVCAKKVDYMKNMTSVDVAKIGVTQLPAPLVLKSQVYVISQLVKQQKEIADTLTSVVDQLKALQDKYEGVANTVKQLAADVDQLKNQVGKQGDEIASLKQSLDQLSNTVTELKQSLESVKKEVSEIKEMYATKDYVDKAVNEIQSKIDELSGGLQQLQDAVSRLKQALNNYATKDEAKKYAQDAANAAKEEAMKALDEQVKNINGKIEDLSRQLNKLKSTVDNLQGTVIKQLSQQLQNAIDTAKQASDNAAAASRWALVAVIVAIIGIIIAIFVALKVMKLTAA